MKKNMKRGLAIAGMTLLLGGISTVYAANDFTFSFSSNVIGKTEFKLSNMDTKCKSKAATYVYNTNSYASFTGNYCITLDGNGFFNPDYKGTYKKADGYMYTTTYGKIKKNTYTVNIGTNSDLIPRGGQIKGAGSIVQ